MAESKEMARSLLVSPVIRKAGALTSPLNNEHTTASLIFLTSTAMQACSSFWLVALVPSQGTVHPSCATQHPILHVDLYFPLLKTQSRFPFTLGLHTLWPCFQIPNTLTAFWKGLTVNTQ